MTWRMPCLTCFWIRFKRNWAIKNVLIENLWLLSLIQYFLEQLKKIEKNVRYKFIMLHHKRPLSSSLCYCFVVLAFPQPSSNNNDIIAMDFIENVVNTKKIKNPLHLAFIATPLQKEGAGKSFFSSRQEFLFFFWPSVAFCDMLDEWTCRALKKNYS